MGDPPQERAGGGREDNEDEGVNIDDEENQVEEAEGENSAVKFRRSPSGAPTQREREEHEATHIPYREWCECCVRARGRRRAHRSQELSDEDREKRRPVIAMDYFFMKDATGSNNRQISLIAAREDRFRNTFC